MAKTFEELVYGGRMQPSNFGRTTIKREQAQEAPYQGRRRADQYEAGIDKRLALEEVEDEKLTEKFGSDDPEVADALKGTGLFTDRGMLPADDIGYQMRLDPVGTRERVARAVAIAGQSGAQALMGEPDTSQYMEGVGKGGERYFTNRPPEEIKRGERQAARMAGRDPEKPVSDLRTINPLLMGGGGTVSGGGTVDSERQAFEGQLAVARGIAEKPERDKKRVLALDKYLGGAIERAASETDVTTELARVKKDLESGALEALGLQMEDAAAVEKALVKRAKNHIEAAKLRGRGTPDEYVLPWVRPGKDGQMADPTLPADILNPGGGPSVVTQAQQRQVMNEAETQGVLDQGLGQEIPRTNHYAKGGKAPQPRSSLDRGGKGGGVMEDINAFTEGEGRHGYGESGPVGMLKDIGAFYGPRLPGDIFAATMGGGVGKGVMRGAKSLKKIRAIENMFGGF